MRKLNPYHRNRAPTEPDEVSLFFERMEPKILFSADALSGLVAVDPLDDSNSARTGLDIGQSAEYLTEAYAPTVNDSDHQDSLPDAQPLELDALQAVLEGRDAANDNTGTDDSLETFLEGSVTPVHERQELIFVDAATPDYEQLLSAVNTDAADTDYQIFVLQSDRDGIEQINEILGGFEGIDAMHLVSHGNETGFQLGDSWLDQDGLSANSELLSGWSSILREDADILIYGCNLAAGEAGLQLIDELADLTGADVAASTDLTGDADQGGDWDLEYRTGDVQANIAVSTQFQANWSYLLAANTAPSFPSTDFISHDITTTADGARFVNTADVDGDGDLDVISASNIDNTIAWHENDGNENFTAHSVTTTAAGAIGVASADLDGDGDIDLVSASTGNHTIAWYQNDGNQNFTAQSILTNATGASYVSTVDVDGDGDIDLLYTAAVLDRVAWLENDGTGSFTNHNITAGADGVAAAIAADLDGDGDMDVLSATRLDDDIVWYENDGNENFTTHSITTNADGARSVSVADLDGDGDLDVLSASQYDNKIAWYENDGSESFTTHDISTTALSAYSVTTADMDGDGDLDVVTASQGDSSIAWYENDGSENFTLSTINNAAGGAINVHVADLDADGDMDVLSAERGDDTIAWYENAGALNGTATYVPGGPPVILDADVDVSDAEMDAFNAGDGNYTGASVTLVRNGGAASEDLFSFNNGNGITLIGANLIKNGQIVATFDITTTPGQLVITFTDANTEIPTSVDVDNILRQITYANSSATPSDSAQIDWTFNDGNTGAQGTGPALQVVGSTTVTVDTSNTAPSFTTAGSGDGVVNTDSGVTDIGRGVTVQSDGKFLVAGDNGTAFGLYRYNADGSLDTSFGGGDGMVATNVSGFNDWGQAVVVQPDGKILVTGYSNDPTDKDLFVIRYESDGTLDATFGTGGVVTTDFANQNDSATGIALQSDGKIIVGGKASIAGQAMLALARYNTDGSLDTSFDGDGRLTLDVGGNDFASGLVIQPDDKILLSGWANMTGDEMLTVVRFDADGSLDLGFGGGDGIAQVSIAAGNEFAHGIALQADGRIVQTGYNDTTGELFVVRWDSDGLLDTSFDTDGIVTTDIPGGIDFARSIAIQDDGKLVVAGYVLSGGDADFTVLRYNTDGSLDTSFGGIGYVTTPGGTDQAFDLALLPDGSIVLVGMHDNGSDADVNLARYNSDGTLNVDFDGVNTLDGAPTFAQGGPVVVLDADVTIRDAELDALNGGDGNYNGASVTLVRNGGADIDDVFSFFDGNGITLAGGNLSSASGVIATFDTSAPGQLVITFSDAATIPTSADVDKVLQQITYANSSGTPPASAQIDWAFSDGAIQTAGVTVVTIIDDTTPPTQTNNAGSTFSEGATDTLITAELLYTDSQQPATSVTYTVTTAAVNGQLELTTGPGVAISSFTQAQIDANLVVYVHDGSDTLSDSFDFDVDDGQGNTLAGQSFSLTITAVNDAPVHLAPAAAATAQDTTLVFSVADGNQISIIDDAGAGLIEVTLTATNGTITIGEPLRSGTELLVNTTTFGDQQKTAAAMDASGNLVVVWESAGQDNADGKKGIYALRYDANGVAQGSEFLVNTTTANDQKEPAIAMDASGNFVIVWESTNQDGDKKGIYAQRYDANGVAQGGEFLVNTTTADDQKKASVAMDAAGNFVIAWESQDQDDGDGRKGIYAQRYDAAGVAQGGEFLVNTTTANDQKETEIAMNASSGDFVIVWESAGQDGDKAGIYAQRYNASGVAQGGEFLVNTTTAGDQKKADVAMDTSGRFVIAWEGVDANKKGVYAQRYDAGGVAQGGEFLVNTTTADDQKEPAVAIDGSGKFTIVWESKNQDGDKSGIYGQRYDVNGVAEGMEFLVNSATADDQKAPALAMDPSGDFVVLWDSKAQDDPDGRKGVFGQRFLASNGFSFLAGDGVDDSVMTFTGRLDDINAVLDGLEFDPTAAFTGLASLQIETDDKGNTGTGGDKTDDDTVLIYVGNRAPVLDNSGVMTLTNVNEDDINPAGNTVAQIILSATGDRITDADPSPIEGIAVIGVDDSNGQWQYNAGAGWIAFGAVSDTNAVLLNDAALVRFVPNADYFGSAGDISFRAWDQTSGRNGDTGADASATGLATAYSIASTAATLNVDAINDALTIARLAGDGLSYNAGDGVQIIEQSGDALVNDVDSLDFDGGNLRVSIVAGGDIAEDLLSIRDQGAGIGNITLSGSDVLYDFGGGPVVIGSFAGGSGGTDLVVSLNSSATPTAVTALVKNITYENTDVAAPTTTPRTVRFTAEDGDGASSLDYDAIVSVFDPNDAPTIANLAGDTLTYNEGDGAQIIAQGGDELVADVDSADFDGGDLRVSFVAGGDVTEDLLSIFDQGPGIGNITVAGTIVRYDFGGGPVDIGNFAGGSGGADLVISLNSNATPAAVTALVKNVTYENLDVDEPTTTLRFVRFTLEDGDSAFSSTNDVTITVNTVNDAPVLDNGGTMTLTDVFEDDANPAGDTVASIIASAGGDRITDVDAAALEGIAVTAVDDSNGQWQFNIGGGWFALAPVSGVNATLLDTSASIRFVPNADYNGSAGNITFKAWDQSSGANGQTGVNASSGGGTTAFSSQSATASLNITAVNDAPILDNLVVMTLTNIIEDDINPPGDTVAAIVSSAGDQITDGDASPVEGFAVTSVDDSNGTWQYSTDSGASWLAFGTVSDNLAVLLDATELIRFVPDPDYNGSAGNITFRAWDQTSDGTGDIDVDVSSNGGFTAFSTATGTASVTVTSVDDPAVISGDISYTGNEGDVVGGTMGATDIEGLTDSTYFTVTSAATNGTAAIDPASGAWTFTPTDPNWFGSDNFTVTVTDDLGGTTNQVVSITLTNVDDPATISGDIAYVGNEGDAVAGVMGATDVDGLTDGTYFTVTGAATNGTAAIDPASGAWTFTPTDPNWFGSDNFTVTVTDDLGGTTTQVVSITLTNVDDPAVISGDIAYVGSEGDAVAGVMGATDVEGLTDGTYFTVTGAATNGTAAIDPASGAWTFTPTDPNWFGSDNFTVTVTDDLGGTTTQVVSITLANVDDPAVISGDIAYVGNEGDAVAGVMGATDVEGLTDGTYFTVTGAATNGTAAIDPASGAWTFTPTDPNWFGSDNFTVTVTDDLGGTTTQVINITLANVDDPATISGDIAYVGNEGDAVAGVMGATDIDGLTDGTYFTVTGAATNGTAAIDPASGAWTFTPTDPNWFGSDNFTVTVTDDLGGTTTQVVSITLANVDDPAVISGDIAYVGNEGDAVAGVMGATDVEGLTDGTYFTVTGAATNGTAAINSSTGAWTFAPTDPNWFGSDNFTVTVTDDLGGTTTQVINITLANVDDPATISGDIAYVGNEGDAVAGVMGATDIDGLTDGTYFTVTGAATNGTAAIDPASGAWTFTPTDPNWFGSDNFTVTVTDDLGGTTTQVVSITLANVDDPAVISGDIAYVGNEGDAVAGVMGATDVEGLTDGTYFTVTGAATNGTAAIDPASGAWTFIPTDPNWFGSDNFTVTVTDDLGGTTTQVINITLANVDDPATISGDIAYVGNEGDAVAGVMGATDIDGLTDGTYFTVTGAATNGTAAIDPASGAWTFTPTDPNWFGSDNFTVTVTDDLGGTTTQVINITLANVDDPAIISGDIAYVGNEGDAVAGVMGATDVDGLTDGTYFTVTGAATNGTAAIDPASGAWTFTPTDPNWFGSDNFTVTVTDDLGGTTTQVVSITLANVDDPAVISGDIAYVGSEGDAVAGVMGATDVEGLTDGTYFTVTGAATNGTAAIDPASGAWTFTPTDPNWFGSDNFTVTVTDDLGGTTTQVVSITLANVDDPAVISGDIAYVGNEGDAVAGVMGATDVEGLTDGTYFTVTGAATNGTAAIDPASGAWTFTPTDPNWFGSDNFTVTVTDDLGGTTTQVVSITLANVDDPAVISGDIAYVGNEGDAVAGNMGATDVDGLTDGTYFTVTGAATNGTAAIDPASGAWTFTPTDPNWFGSDNFTVTVTDDLGGTTTQVINITLANVDDPAVISGDIAYVGNEGDAVAGNMGATDVEGLTDGTYFSVTAAATNGTAAINPATGAWTFTPTDPNWFGSDNFTVTVTDDLGGTTTQVVNITLANVDDPAVISGDIAYVGNEGDAVAGNMSATDVEGLTDGTYFSVTAAATNGTAAINPATGAWTFTPTDPNWFGSDNFTVTVTDDLGGTTTQVVNITLANVDDPAVISGDIAYVGNEGDAVAGNMGVTDVDGLTDGTYFSVTAVATNGTAAINPATGAWTFTPTDPNWIGSDNFTVTVTDDLGGTTTQVVNITLANVDDDPAVISGDIAYAGNEGDAVAGNMTATDPEGLTDGTYFTVTAAATNGTAAINPATGAWTFTPTDPNWFGSDNFTVTVTDDLGGTTTQVVNITLANVDDPAVISGDIAYVGNEGDAVAGNMGATDVEGLTDGTYFSVTAAATNGTAAINPSTGAWTFTPTDPNWIGSDNFTVTVTDDLGGTTTQVVNITLSNVDDDPAVISGDIAYVGNEGDAVAGTMTATDPEGLTDGTYFTVTGAATNGTAAINPSTGAWTFTPTDPNWFGSDNFTVTVTDDLGGTTAQVVNITLGPVNDAPVAVDDAVSTAGNTVLNGNVPTASDIDGTIDPNGYALGGTTVAQGSLIFNTDGSYSFNPGTDFDNLALGATRDVTFTYIAADNLGLTSAEQTVTITVSGTNAAVIGGVDPGSTDDGTEPETPPDDTPPVVVQPPESPGSEYVDVLAENDPRPYVRIPQTPETETETETETTEDIATVEESVQVAATVEESVPEAPTVTESSETIASQPEPTGIENSDSGNNDNEEIDPRSQESLLAKMDDMRASIENDDAYRNAHDLKAMIFLGVSASLTAGVVSWVLRGGSLLASLMSAIPVLSRFYLLPIIKVRDDEEEVEPDDDTDLTDLTDPDQINRKRVENMFSDHQSGQQRREIEHE